MTASRDSDRLVRAWLDLMPSEAPDRVVDAVLQAVETTPQVRPPFGAALRRPLPMNRLSIAAIAAAIVVVFAGALVLTRFTPPPNGASSPTPGTTAGPATPTPTGAAGNALPTALRGVWLSSNRAIGGLPSVAGTALHIGPDSIALTPSSENNRNLIAVGASSSGSTLTIDTSPGPSDDCQPGQTGTYTYALSASGQTLTIGGEDECAQRAHLFGGTWWLSDCHTQDQEPCFGLLDPGAYGSEYFASIGAHGAPWVARYGSLTFTVPSGWASDADWPSAFSLTPAVDFAATPLHGYPAAGVVVYSNVVPESQTTPCSGQADPVGELDAQRYVSWLRTVPGLSVGNASTFTIDGQRATMVDVTVPKAPTRLCDGTDAVIEYVLSIGWSGATGIQTHAIAPGDHDRLILVDMPSGYLTAILVTTVDASRFDAFWQQALPVVRSFKFTDAFPTP
jgi:hypothetical protein